MNRKQAFSFVELLMAVLIVSSLLCFLPVINQVSKKQTLDAYYGFMATSIAIETLELFRGLGYEWVEEFESSPEFFQDSKNATEHSPFGANYPADAAMFQRIVSVNKQMNCFQVTVTVIPVAQGKVANWFGLNKVELSTLIFRNKP